MRCPEAISFARSNQRKCWLRSRASSTSTRATRSSAHVTSEALFDKDADAWHALFGMAAAVKDAASHGAQRLEPPFGSGGEGGEPSRGHSRLLLGGAARVGSGRAQAP